MARKAEKSGGQGKSKGVKARSAQHEGSASHSGGNSSVKGSAKSSGSGSFGKTSLGKGCLPAILMGLLIVIGAIILL